MIFRIATQFTWGIGLIAAALILGKKAEDPLPWAVGILGAIVLVGTLFGAMAADNATTKKTDARPSAAGTP